MSSLRHLGQDGQGGLLFFPEPRHSLAGLLGSKVELSRGAIRLIAWDLLCAIRHCHELGVVHRNISASKGSIQAFYPAFKIPPTIMVICAPVALQYLIASVLLTHASFLHFMFGWVMVCGRACSIIIAPIVQSLDRC